MDEVKEKGTASLKIELEDGIITIFHGADGNILKQWTGSGTDWNTMWKLFEKLANKNQKESK